MEGGTRIGDRESGMLNDNRFPKNEQRDGFILRHKRGITQSALPIVPYKRAQPNCALCITHYVLSKEFFF